MKIKGILTNRYEISLYETDNGYQVHYNVQGEDKVSENIIDYFTADHLFEMKYEELEGQ
jgi:hypothetical protein